MVIGIAGKMGAGKDAIAAILIRKFGFVRRSMADPLRWEVSQALGLRMAPDCAPEEITRIIECGRWTPEAVHQKPTPHQIRRVLQWWGTEYRRDQDANYWTDRMRESLSMHSGHVVIPDIRFANEAAMVRALGGQVWIVRRSQADAERDPAAHSHISELFCDAYADWDLQLTNDGTIEDLEDKVTALMRCQAELDRCAALLASNTLTISERAGCAGGQIDWQREMHAIAREAL